MNRFSPVAMLKIAVLPVLLSVGVVVSGLQVDRPISIDNDSGSRVEVKWIQPETREAYLMSNPDLHTGASLPLGAYVGHSFQVNELYDAGSHSICRENGQNCRSAEFTVNENWDQVFTILKSFVVEHTDDTTVVVAHENSDMLNFCKQKQILYLQQNSHKMSPAMATTAIDDLVACVGNSIVTDFEEFNEEIAFHSEVRTAMGEALENYTCADEDSKDTKPHETRVWNHKGANYTVNVMVERMNSKIHVVENFINEDECAAMEKAAKPYLHKATVADSDGGSQLSENRKALQAGIKVPWDKEAKGNPIAVLSRRVFDYTNYATGLELEHHGQEDLMSIQYVGRGETEKAPDRYMPHCDGSCTGLNHKAGGRVATMVMYCVVAEKGGATNFRNSYVKVKAKKGSAVFFSYIGLGGVMDNGFTEHSGCPVIVGEKKIVTQWMRLGVDADNAWDSWNTLGVKITDTLND